MNQPTPIDPKVTIEWLNRLVMMAQWPGKLPFHLVRLYEAPQQYQKFLLQVRTGATDDTDDTDQIVKTAREKLLEAVAKWPSLRELFAATEDPFANASVDHLQLLADVSDITTDPQRMVWSRNGTFVAVVEALRQSQDFEPETLIVDWLNKFFELLEKDEQVAEMLYDLAGESYWLVVMASLRDGRDYTHDEDPIVGQRLRHWPASTKELSALLFKHLSRAPAKLIRMAWTNRQLFTESRNSIPDDKRATDPIEERKQVVNESLELFKDKATDDYLEVQGDLIVLSTVARHYINVRKFAKLDGFVYTWPDIARLAMSNYPALEYVEELLVNRKPRPADTDLDAREARDLYELCAKNDRLIRFLRLRPRFAEIDDDELRRYRPLAPVVIRGTSAPEIDFPGKGGDDFNSPPSPDTAPLPPPAKPLENSYIEIVLEYEATPPASVDERFYSVSLFGSDYTSAGYKFGLTIRLLEQVRGAIGVGSDNELQSVLRDLFTTSATQAEARLTRAGLVLLNQVLSEDMRNQYIKLLADNRPLRLIVKSSESEPHYLPWEWLPGFSPSQLFLSTPEHSVVRDITQPTEATTQGIPSPLITPLRLMSIVPSAPVGQRFTSDTTIRALQAIISGEPVEYKSLIRSEATPADVARDLVSFRPHVVHFEGFIDASPTEPGDGLITFYFGGAFPFVTLNAFAQELKDNGVQLFVIGRNAMAQMYENLGARTAIQLIKQGVPAVIAPMRAIDDASATTFITEFYRAFLQGNTLESALHIARRKLASKGGDWSVFALFANPAYLDHFQLLRESLA